jgi:hypothetical protein
METTIRINKEIKKDLDLFREYKNESYNEIIKKLLYLVQLCDKDPKLSQNSLKEIMLARERIKKGKFYTEEEARKILGL